MSININDLSSDLLKYILNFLSDKQLFLVESVCTKWQKCVRKLLDQKESLKRLDHYSHKFVKTEKFWFGIRIVINDNNINILKNILSKCYNIKHLNLWRTDVDGNSLIEIVKLCSKLESIHFLNPDIYAYEDEMDEFGKIIAPQLKKCKLKDFFLFQ